MHFISRRAQVLRHDEAIWPIGRMMPKLISHVFMPGFGGFDFAPYATFCAAAFMPARKHIPAIFTFLSLIYFAHIFSDDERYGHRPDMSLYPRRTESAFDGHAKGFYLGWPLS